MDLREDLERSIGVEPPLPAPEQRLAAGRRGMRRRRAVISITAVAAAVALAAPVALLRGGESRTPDVISPAPPSSTQDSSELDSQDGYDFTFGELSIDPEARVHRRVDGIVPGRPSTALDITFRGERRWHVIQARAGTSYVGISSAPGDEPGLYRDFDEFVAKASFAMQQWDDVMTGPDSLMLDVVDGAPDVVGAGASIGPVLREGDRGFGFEVEVAGTPSYVLIVSGVGGTWRVLTIEAAGPGSDLAAWLRAAGWLPTGEGAGS